MKGLLLKDLLIIKTQSRAMLLILFCGIFMSLSLEPTTVITYLTVVGVMVSTGTFGYDEFDNGQSFLFSLPFERKTYVYEKYLFSILCALACMLVGSIASAGIILFKGNSTVGMADILIANLLSMTVVTLVVSMMIPIRTAFDTEKAKTMQFLIYGSVLLLVIGGAGLLKSLGVDAAGFLDKTLSSTSPYVLAALLAFVLACILFVSMKISLRAIAKKEF